MKYPKHGILWGQASIAWTDLRHYFPVQDVSFIAREKVSDFKGLSNLVGIFLMMVAISGYGLRK